MVEYTARAKKGLRKLDRKAAERILNYMDDLPEDPRDKGKALLGTVVKFTVDTDPAFQT
ncbi:hypothetical protein [Maridesulfovibrio sp.]|uniref:type II toxin-antitoxin system RelE family toxin n=1 Tax=Maridesulfovibrio sp. TaxID=2795000 RepID=UPI002A188AF0|nr:hypothetical protein [Maridesulfovibrio sp.]